MRKKQKIINLYQDKGIGNIKYVVSIGNEEDLNQFWHYFDSDIKNDYELLYSFIGLMYAFIVKLFEEKKDIFFELIIEQNSELFYVTIWNSTVSASILKLIKKQKNGFEYKIDAKRITIKLVKQKLLKDGEITDAQQESRRENLIASVVKKSSFIQPVYTFLEAEDKLELLNICDDMIDLMYQSKSVGLQDDTFIKLRSFLSMFTLNISSYPQLLNISNLIIEFSVLMNVNQEAFQNMSLEEITLIEGFINNIDRWVNTLFVNGGADLHFMDGSLKADLQMIKMRIFPPEVSEEELDDIFDF